MSSTSNAPVIPRNEPFRYYMGWDSHEIIAHEVASLTCRELASVPVAVMPLQNHVLRAQGIYTRPRDKNQNTEFTYLRFLVPYLADYKGWALFTDDDFMWRADIKELLDYADDRYAVMVVKHSPDIKCHTSTKLAGVPQEMYPRKNWSSVMLINCGHPAVKKLTPQMVATQTPAYLHRLYWAVPDGAPQDDESLIGELPVYWNCLVDWYDAQTQEKAKLVHWTDGGPWYPDYRNRVNDDGTVGVHHQGEWLAAMTRYESKLPQKRLLYPYERFTTSDPPKIERFLPGYANSNERWTWDMDDQWQEYVKANILVDKLPKQSRAAETGQAAAKFTREHVVAISFALLAVGVVAFTAWRRRSD